MLSTTEAELKKYVAYKKVCIENWTNDSCIRKCYDNCIRNIDNVLHIMLRILAKPECVSI